MKQANLIISTDFYIGETDPRLFGSFIEHMGSVIYNGVFEPEHPTASKEGFRMDVLNFTKELGLAVMRYPGGNYTSGYNWKDTIGPLAKRPQTMELAWRAIEPNTFGLNEFMTWSKQVGAQPIITVNLGTKGIEDAAQIVEYCNFPSGTKWSDLRIAHGVKEPYKVKIWCLGNELDGEWQIARKSADEYGRLACEAGKVMRLADSDIELIAVGSSARHLDSFPNWDMTVMMHTYEIADYLSVHNYINKKQDDTATYLARPIEMDKQIDEVLAACDYVKAIKRSDKVMYLSFDEFNVHKEPQIEYEPWQTGSPFDWCRYNMEDTLVFGSMLLIILRHADRIKIACQSLLVNTIPLILTLKGGDAWRNATYFPLMHVSKYARGTVLNTLIDTPLYQTEAIKDVPAIDHVAVLSENKKELTLFCINRLDEEVELIVDIKEEIMTQVIEHLVMNHEDLQATNTLENKETLIPYKKSGTTCSKDQIKTRLFAYSWNVIRIRVAGLEE